jgi:hypothetical protein
MFGFFKRGSRSENGGGLVITHDAGVKPPLKAHGYMTVRRFQGTFECGCEAHPLDEPMECPVHGVPKYYIAEPTQIMDTAVVTEG